MQEEGELVHEFLSAYRYCTHYPNRTVGAGDIFLAISVVDGKAGALLYLFFAILKSLLSGLLGLAQTQSLGPDHFFLAEKQEFYRRRTL
jgi:hypothetical protein